MAITPVVHLTIGEKSDAGHTSVATASVSPTGSRLQLLGVSNSVSSGTPNIPTVTGDGITWVQVATVLELQRRLTIFRGMVASPTTGALTIDFAGQTQVKSSWSLDEFAGVDTSGTNGSGAVVQSATNSIASGTTTGITVSLAAFGSVNNAAWGFCHANTAQPAHGTGFTELGTITGGSNNNAESEWEINNNSVAWTWASGTPLAQAAAVEVKAASGTVKTLAAAINGATTITATVVRVRARAASITGSTTVTATLARIRARTATINGSTTITAGLSSVRTKTLAATITGSTAVTASLVRVRTLAASINGATSVTASFAVQTAPSVATYTLQIAFNELIAGVFTLNSALDGPDALSDVGLYDGTYDDVSLDLDGSQPIVITMGTDQLAGNMQASSVTFTLSRPDDPSYWNPNNPASPLNSVAPGFEVMRPVRFQAVHNGVTYGVFTGFIRRPTWRSDTRSCEVYCEDLLLWASRVYPVIAATGPTTTGAVIDLLWDAVGYLGDRSTATGDSLADFSADGSQNVPSLISTLLEAERGTVYIGGDGVPVYESRDMAQTRQPSATVTVTEQTSVVESGKDVDFVFTRASVNGYTSIDADAEHRLGRGDLPAIANTYVADSQRLADDLVYAGALGKPPVTLAVANVDAATLTLILSSPLLSVFTIDDSFGGTTGDGIVQRLVHTISTGFHQAEYTLTKRAAREFALDSALDGSDVFRY